MKEQDKFPQTWEQAKTNMTLINLEKGCFEMDYNDSAKLMAERYEKRIDELENQWISVENRLPEIQKDYLVFDGYACMVAAWKPHKQIWDFWDNNKFWDSDEVTHWMPLPKPPQ